MTSLKKIKKTQRREPLGDKAGGLTPEIHSYHIKNL